MELRQLRYFVAVAEELHYGEASTRLNISKPTLSQQIGVLERSLGTKLLDRSGRHVLLTEAGAVLLAEARQILAACDRARNAVTAASHRSRPLQVRITNGLQHALHAEFDEIGQDGDLHINWTLTSGPDAEDAVVTGRADAAITWMPSGEFSTLHATVIGGADVSLALPEQHPLCSQDTIAVEDLTDVPIVLFPREQGPGTWDLFVKHLRPNFQRTGGVIAETGGLSPMMHMLDLVAAGKGVAPFVHVVAQAVAPEGVCLRPMSPPLTLPAHLVCRDPTRADLRQLAALLAGT